MPLLWSSEDHVSLSTQYAIKTLNLTQQGDRKANVDVYKNGTTTLAVGWEEKDPARLANRVCKQVVSLSKCTACSTSHLSQEMSACDIPAYTPISLLGFVPASCKLPSQYLAFRAKRCK